MNIENSLKKLGLSGHNIGTSTGSNYFSNGDSLSSYSPVDGKEIDTGVKVEDKIYRSGLTTLRN